MAPRSIDEDHRAATPLELFFDLCFVVAVAQAASRLHHDFDLPAGEVVDRARRAFSDSWRPVFTWGYGHFFVFASAAAVGAGLQVAVDRATHHAEVSRSLAWAAVAVPVALYLFSVWALHFRQKRPGPMRVVAVPATTVLLAASLSFGQPVVAIGVVLAGLVGLSIVLSCWDVRSSG
jgi:low temperature requirement protein LtrA